MHLKRNLSNGRSIINFRDLIYYNFALDKLSSHKKHKEPKNKLFKKMSKSVSFHTTFYSEGNDQNPIDFNGETISFTCQLAKI